MGNEIKTATIVNVPSYHRGQFINSQGEIGKGGTSFDIYSHAKVPTEGPACIHAVWQAMGLNVDSRDPRLNNESDTFTNDDLRSMVNTDLLGFTSMTRGRQSTIAAAGWAKGQARQRGKNLITVAGGIDPTLSCEEYLKSRFIDYVVIGEGERTARELIDALNNNTPLENIQGLAFIKDGNITKTAPRPFMTPEELLNEPIPILSPSIAANSRMHITCASRGCPGNCEFCSVREMWGPYRMIPSQRVIEEIKQGKGKTTFLLDDTFLPPGKILRERKKQLMRDIITAGLNDRYYCIQVDTPSAQDREAVELAIQMGVMFVYLAVESRDPGILKTLRKMSTVQQNLAAIKIWKQAGAYVHTLNIAGVHGETPELSDSPEKLQQLADWLIHESGSNSMQIFIETALPRTDLAEKRNLLEIAEKDTSLVDLQHAITDDVPKSFGSNYELQRQVNQSYRDFYSLTHLPKAVLETLRPIFPLKRSLTRVMSTIILRIYGHKIVRYMLDEDPNTAHFMNYLKSLTNAKNS